jgi:hypothetical protein
VVKVVVVDSKKDAARIRHVSVRTIDRMVAAGILRKVRLSEGRVGIVGARDLPNEELTITEEAE